MKGRILIGATGSGAGKTMITCGIMAALKERGLKISAFKCGPDYIDPMFHAKVLGLPSRNLDTFFTGRGTTRALLASRAEDSDYAVIEGVMGFYDGIGLDSSKAGAWDLARVTETPALLVVPAKGMGRSLIPMIRGFLKFKRNSMIRGILLNRISEGLYPRMKAQIEQELGIPVVGFLPPLPDCALESRHLGLQQPGEIRDLKKKIRAIRREVERCVDLDAVLAIAETAPEIEERLPEPEKTAGKRLRIGVARDEAFTFFYEENLDMLKRLGAKLVFFSPMKDQEMPKDLDGLILVGGYPEIYAEALSANREMRTGIAAAVEGGLPTIAECGGFLYLHAQLADLSGKYWPMAGVFAGKAWHTGRLQRFGYIHLREGRAFGQKTGAVRSHEFHYYESEDPGTDFLAEKPAGNRSWRCYHSTDTLLAGFPHLYFPAGPGVPAAFLAACGKYREKKRRGESA